ncbi:MAG: transcriptional repressor LexA [Thermoanaerobaculia bacterium]|nr:transcriptional repressor LexA [Thermoanaerobaculia bacterium]
MASYLTARQKEILEFIHQFRKEKGLAPTHREICERFGFSSYGTAYKHLKLLSEKGFLKRDRHQRRGMELLDGEGAESSPIAPIASITAAGRELPFLGRIAAGRPIEAVVGDETLTVPAALFGARIDEHFVLRVAGESMIGEGIHDGDWVVVERRERAQPGEMVVALVGDEVTLKRFYPEGAIVRLQPSNPAMEPIRVPAADLRIQGIVVGLMRKY